jgi:hypothetical protein
VHASIQLDGQAAFEAEEVDHVVVDRVLAAELQAKASVSQQVPSCFFSVSLFAA